MNDSRVNPKSEIHAPFDNAREDARKVRCLLVEDDLEFADSIGAMLANHSVDLRTITDGGNARDHLAKEKYDVIVVDRMLPSLPGLELVRSLRSGGDNTPILMLTALGGLDDRVTGLESGADDYLVKPFDYPELVARLNALVRRSRAAGPRTRLRIADLEVDLLTRTVTRAGTLIDLQAREFQLLTILALHDGKPLTRAMLLERVWGFNFNPRTSVVETHVSRLRSKIDYPFETPLIHTIRGVGYALHAATGAPE